MSSPCYKLIYYVPDAQLESTKEACFSAGAGRIGNYSHCAWQVRGIGQFKPLAGANPAIGAVGDLETLEEWRVEMIVPQNISKNVVKALLSAHPYEEPAWELVQLITIDMNNDQE